MTKYKTHIVIPDCQVKPDQDYSYLSQTGNYIAEKKPDVVICIGDFTDFPSLSSYDVGKRSFEGRRISEDIQASRKALALLMSPINEARSRDTTWNPRLVITLGNHEQRLERVLNEDPKLYGTISLKDLGWEENGWGVYPFLEPITIDGICYAHYFTSGTMGRPVSSAKALVQKKHMSCVMGHVQDWQIHREVRADGTPIMGMFVGSFYTHNEDYLGNQGNNYSRQLWVLHEVDNPKGFLPKPVSIDYIVSSYKSASNKQKKYSTDEIIDLVGSSVAFKALDFKLKHRDLFDVVLSKYKIADDESCIINTFTGKTYQNGMEVVNVNFPKGSSKPNQYFTITEILSFLMLGE